MLFSHQHFFDFDQLVSVLKMADLENYQMDRGPFWGELEQLLTQDIMLVRHRMTRTIFQRGSILKDYYAFVLPVDFKQFTYWRNQIFTGSCLGIFPPTHEHEGLTRDNFNTYSLSIHKEVMEEALEGFDQKEFFRLHQQGALLQVNQEGLTALQQRIGYILSLHRQFRPSPQLFEKTDSLMGEIPRMILELMLNEAPDTDRLSLRLRDQAFQRAMDYIIAHAEDPIRIKELCSYASISERTLRYVFEEKLAYSPKQFIQAYRLNRFRKYLMHSDQDQYKIVDLANHYGYWHMGQLAADYKKLFGELPSETLENQSKPELILPPALAVGF